MKMGSATPLAATSWFLGAVSPYSSLTRRLGVTHVAMEATGDFWKPVYYLLEADFELLLVNPAHIKHVPGRKTDAIDVDIAAISGRIEAEIGPFAEKAKLLPSITGVGSRAAE